MRIRCLMALLVALHLVLNCVANALFAQTGPTGNRFPGTSQPAANQPAANQQSVAPPASSTASRPAGSSDTAVVVLDVAEVFKQHYRFKQAMEEIKDEVKKLEGLAQNDQKSLMKKKEQMDQFTAGTTEYKRFEEDLARGASDLQIRMQIGQKDIMEREAKIYFNTYNEVRDLVKDFSDRNGIKLVLRFNRMSMDPTKRETVLQGVNAPIVYQNKLDITDLIIAQCNRGMTTPPDNRSPGSPNTGSAAPTAQKPAIPPRLPPR